MTIRLSIVIYFTFLHSMLLCGQTDSTKKIVKFKLTAPSYNIFPADKFLFIGYDNHIKIIVSPANINYSCSITNGKIKKTTDSTYVIYNNLPVKTLLSIYTKDYKGKEVISLNKEYTYVPFPSIKISGVKCDSAITKLMLAAGTFYAEFKGIGKYQVNNFKMEIYENKKFIEISSVSGRLSKKMLEYLNKLKAGTLLTFKDLKFTTSDGVAKTEPIYRVFLIDDKNAPIKLGL
jgi:hypothetical protein